MKRWIFVVALLAACNDPFAPPAFKQAVTADRGSGHGGGSSQCTKPNASPECLRLFGGLVLTGGLIAGTCPVGPVTGVSAIACAGLVNSFGNQAITYNDTPDCRTCSQLWPSYPTIGPQHIGEDE